MIEILFGQDKTLTVALPASLGLGQTPANIVDATVMLKKGRSDPDTSAAFVGLWGVHVSRSDNHLVCQIPATAFGTDGIKVGETYLVCVGWKTSAGQTHYREPDAYKKNDSIKVVKDRIRS